MQITKQYPKTIYFYLKLNAAILLRTLFSDIHEKWWVLSTVDLYNLVKPRAVTFF